MATRSSSPDVIIVGGGVIGLATAYFLGAEHYLRCTIVERDGIGTNASGFAAGELNPVSLHVFPEPLTRFAIEAVRLHKSMAPALLEESGIDYRLTDTVNIRPAFSEAEAASLRKMMDWEIALGLRADWLDPAALHQASPWLSGEALAALREEGLQLETYPYNLALAQAAERHGTEIRSGEVTGLTVEGDRVTGVELSGETLNADSVVVANGPWSKLSGGWLGFEVPVTPLKGQIVHLEPQGPVPSNSIFHETGYVLPKPSGEVYVGTTEEHAGFFRDPTDEARDAIMTAVGKLAPIILEAPIKSVTACLRPLSLDLLPLIGAVPGRRGFYLATGHGFKGILLSLVTGKYIAQLIVRGRTDYPLDDFSPARTVTPAPGAAPGSGARME